jgi:hypothetical protein
MTGFERFLMAILSPVFAGLCAAVVLTVAAPSPLGTACPMPAAPAHTSAASTPIAHRDAKPDNAIAAELADLRRRTEDLRLALDTLIRAMPRAGFEHVPVIGDGWSRVGEAREEVRVQDWDGVERRGAR